jgi:hypothetical protein
MKETVNERIRVIMNASERHGLKLFNQIPF